MRSRADANSRIVIGSLSQESKGAIYTITREFISGLGSRYAFVPHYVNRKHGLTRQARFNIVNLFYFVKHFASWVLLNVRYRPQIAHYPITSFWNLEKSLLFLAAARMLGSRTIGHLHGGAFIEFWRALPAWRKRFAEKELAKLDGFIVLSDWWKKAIASDIGIAERKIHIVHNMVDAVLESSLLSMPIPHEGDRVLCIGVMSRMKGVQEILEATQIVSTRVRCYVDLVGPDREPGVTDRCRTWIQANDLSSVIMLHGAIWQTDKKIEMFRHAAMLLIPSHVENLPLVVLEAAAAGLPIIATPVGALPEFFCHEKSIIFVERGNSREIARRIEDLVREPQLRAKLGAGARRVFRERFNREAVLSSLDRVYQSVISECGAPKGRHVRSREVFAAAE